MEHGAVAVSAFSGRRRRRQRRRHRSRAPGWARTASRTSPAGPPRRPRRCCTSRRRRRCSAPCPTTAHRRRPRSGRRSSPCRSMRSSRFGGNGYAPLSIQYAVTATWTVRRSNWHCVSAFWAACGDSWAGAPTEESMADLTRVVNEVMAMSPDRQRDHEDDQRAEADDDPGEGQAIAALCAAGPTNVPAGPEAQDDAEHGADADQPEDGEDERGHGQSVGPRRRRWWARGRTDPVASGARRGDVQTARVPG